MGNSQKRLNLVTGFDYEILESQERIVVQQRTGEIRERLQRSAQDIWEIGQKLADVRSRLKHGQFDTWLKAEFGWSRRTAYNFINVYEAFPERANFAQINIATSALYLLAAPSTSQELRDEVLQRAKEGEPVTYKEIRQVIKEEKSQSPAVEKPQSPKPEIVALKPKALVEAENSVVEVTALDGIAELEDEICRGNAPVLTPESGGATTEGLPLQTPINIQPGWYMLEKQHLLFCGDTASPKFVERIPQAALAIAITGDDWDHDWLIERAKTVIVFPESSLKEQMLSSLLSMFSTPGEAVIFPWLPDSTMLAIAHKLERNIFAGDMSPERCRKAIAHSQLLAEPINL
ncbi:MULTISPECIES: DUF3102 domain-containing protein [Kamptonema]|uniref:DUF3102 domain-containing protein n=1 Tax=Kamptonema TaxID=1501433 RepID=UPI0001DACCF7|nr:MULTISPECIES: DUF3102 domain-containing protein [Kamptonema]CBN59232.1 conserved hypothetical protein [Kamptonema sp. PCC 6506]